MVKLVGHTFVNGAVDLDVDVIADVIGSEVGGEMDGTFLPESSSEQISCSRSQSMTGRHC
ncbi:hypothetical protein Hanom_Chr15g01400941 [Helianthus anomalus]